MLFQSQVFLLVFLPLTLAAFFLAARRVVLRETVLIAASLIFYGWWDIRFLPLIVSQTVLSWALAVAYRKAGGRHLPLLGVAANLAVLGFFKYMNFFAETLSGLTGAEIGPFSIVLPIGISFYTFQIISYLVDLERGRAPLYGARRFLLYVLLFPQLIAGPIVRHDEIMDEFDRDPLRDGLAERIGRGATLFVIGLLKKVFLADPLARIADPIFDGARTAIPDLASSWTGLLAFTFQIFLDFSAYSEMAIGLGMVFGLSLPTNFEQPYRSLSIRDFWRRWHMTLSRFLRDYLYIPLGGSWHGPARYVFATVATMGLCGLWHGAGWTFVVWGLYHGVGLMICRLWEQTGGRMAAAPAWVLTFLFVILGWVFFRAADFPAALAIFQGLAGFGAVAVPAKNLWLIAAAAFISIPLPSPRRFVEESLPPWRPLAAAAALAALLVVLEVGKGQPVSFIYFQF